MTERPKNKAGFHLPGLFEFYELYSAFLPLYRNHREYFYDFCEIASLYGAPGDCIWAGGRACGGEADIRRVLELTSAYGISAVLTFSNLLLEPHHLEDRRCNSVCRQFESGGNGTNGVIVASDILRDYLRAEYPGLYLVSSTTKVLPRFEDFVKEASEEAYRYIVPDFRHNKALTKLALLPEEIKKKMELLCNECCPESCSERRACYENVSRKNLGIDCPDHICRSPGGERGYRFSEAKKNPAFIGVNDITDKYLPMGFSEFKIEGRGLGSAMVLEFLLYYLIKPEYELTVREEIYLDSMLDLF